MKKIVMVLLGTAGIGAAVLVTALTPVRALSPACGPGPHWIDNCTPGGTDHFDRTGALVGVNVGNNCSFPGTMNLILWGPVDVARQARSDDSARFPGLRPVDGHLDVIDTEIVSMNLTGSGITLLVGTSTPGINPAVPRTFGAVAEEDVIPPTNSSLGDSFFDVFFEVTGVPGGPVYSHTPLRVQAVISYVPPAVVYVHPTGLCLPLFNDPVGGVQLYTLVQAQHDTSPPVGGIAELPNLAGTSPQEAASPAGGSGWSAGGYAALAGGLAAVIVVLGAGTWYARRRWLR